MWYVNLSYVVETCSNQILVNRHIQDIFIDLLDILNI